MEHIVSVAAPEISGALGFYPNASEESWDQFLPGAEAALQRRDRDEEWLLCETARIARKRFCGGDSGLSNWERLVFSVWMIHDMVVNRRKLAAMTAIYSKFKAAGFEVARNFGLWETASVFEAAEAELARAFDARFEIICDDLRSVTGAERR